MSECRFVVGSLGSAASPRPPSLGEQNWRLSAGVLGETALPGFLGDESRVAGAEVEAEPRPVPYLCFT
jgi:hypothetical protein